jgi:transcriptional/translational regulatory protein YebC/TACO1
MIDSGGVKWMFENNNSQWLPKYQVKINENEKQDWEKLLDELQENDSVQQVFSNLEKE